MDKDVQSSNNTPVKKVQSSTPTKQDNTSRRGSLTPRKASASSIRPQATRAKSSSLGPRKNPPNLPPKNENAVIPDSPKPRKPSAAPRRPSKLTSKPSATDTKRKPPKLPPKGNGQQRPALKARKSSAVLEKDIESRMKQIDTQKSPSEQQDLKSILSDPQREELTRLTSSIMDRMRKTIEDNFDATATLQKIRNENSEEDSLANIDFDPGTVDVGEYDKERKLRDERLKELSKPQIRELKEASLRWFDSWRAGFMRRVAEAVDKKSPPQQTPGGAQARPKDDVNRQIPPKLEQLFPRVPTSLTKLPIPRRELILHSFLLLLLSLENYNAASRVFLLYLTSSLKLGLKSLREDEEKTAKGLLQAAKQISASRETIEKGKESEESRRWKMRLATVAGAAVVGLSGGYAAPLIAASVGGIMSELGLGASAAAGYLGSVAGNTYVVGSLFGAYGGRMTSEVMRNVSADVQDFAFLPVHGERKEHKNSIEAVTDSRRLRVTIAISGWLLEKEEVITPWRVLTPSSEVFALRFELETLMKLGQSINTMASNSAYGYAQSAFATRSAYSELSSAIWPLALVKIARVVENPFSIAKFRAEKAGKVLAETLINRAQGERPVTLVGYSLGARVIWSCLTTLAERRAFGLVESAVLIGSPSPSDISTWRLMRTAVSGRLVNVYSTNDYLLAFLHRASSLQYGVAGLAPIPGLSGVENFDLSDTVSGHLRYRYLAGAILQKIGFEGLDKVEIAKEAEAFKRMVDEEDKQDLVQDAKKGAGEIYKQYEKRKQQSPNKKISDAEAERQATAMEKEVQQKTQKGLMQWAVEQLYISRPSLPSTGDSKINESTLKNASKSKPNTLEQNKDAVTKSMYQRAKDAVYLTRSGGAEGEKAAKSKAAGAQNTASSGVSQSYLATAAGYIPTGYIPSFRSSGKAEKPVDGSTAKQATKKPPSNDKTEGVAASEGKPKKEKADKSKRPKMSTVQEKPNENTDDSAAATTKDAQPVKEQEQEQVTEASTAGEDTPTETPKTTEAPDNASANRAPESSGMTSYIPSFGFGTSSRSSKDSVPGWTPSTSDDPGHRESGDDKTADEAEGAGAAEDASGHEDESKTPKEKASSSYGSYIPSFGLGNFSGGKSKEAGKGKGKAPEDEKRDDGGNAKEDGSQGKDNPTEEHDSDDENKSVAEDKEGTSEEGGDGDAGGEARDETENDKVKKADVEKKVANTADLEDPFVD